MLVRHSAAYLVTRGTSAAIQLLALSVFSHLVSPAEYGRYALAVIFAFTARAILFEWLYLGVLRLLPNDFRKESFLATVLACYLTLAGVCLCIAIAVALLTNQESLLVLGVVALLLAAAFHEINLQLAARQLSPGRYAALAVIKAGCVLLFGALGAISELAENGLLLGAAAGYAFSSVALTLRAWCSISLRHANLATVRDLARYGIPLGVTAGLGILAWNTDRMVLGYLIGPSAVGPYALGAELAAQSVGMLMTTINLAGFPIALRTLEREGFKEARGALAKQAILLGVLALPSAAALAVFASDISLIAFSVQFREVAATTIAWIALAALINGLRAYYFDMAFQLGERTKPQVAITIATGLVNVGLTVGLVSAYGTEGAAAATAIAAVVGLVLSWSWGRTILKMPIPLIDWSKCLLATAAAALIVFSLAFEPGIPRLLAGMAAAGITFVALAWTLNVAGFRATKQAARS